MLFLRFEGDLIAETWEVDPEQITRQLAGEADPDQPVTGLWRRDH